MEMIQYFAMEAVTVSSVPLTTLAMQSSTETRAIRVLMAISASLNLVF